MIPFAAELESMTRPELALGVAGYLRYWPKVRGANVLATSVTYRVLDPAGVEVVASTSTTPATIDGVSRCAVSLTPSGGLWRLAEDWRIEFTFTAIDEDGLSASYVQSLNFDVVIEPLGDLGVSLNNLAGDDNAASVICERHASALDPQRSAQNQAQIYVMEAVADLRKLLKRKVKERGEEWPRYIANKDDLRAVVVAGALHRMYRAQGFNSDAAVRAAQEWRDERDTRFSDLPDLRFSSDTDRQPDVELRGFRTIILRRGA